MLTKRIIVGILLIVGSITFIFLGTWAMSIEVLIIGVLGLNEFYDLAYRKGIRPSKANGLISGIILFLGAYFLNEYDSLAVLTILIIYTLVVFIFRKNYHISSFLDAGVTILGYLYIGWLFSFIIRLRRIDIPMHLDHWTISLGAVCAVFLVLANSFTDIGSFFVGKYLGKRKLCPDISPGKTVEGSLGGIVTALLASGVWGYYSGIPLYHCIILGILISIFAQLGDLWESVLKRDVSVKDSGDIIIGHGGILDRFDSLFLTSPVAYLYFKYIFMVMMGWH